MKHIKITKGKFKYKSTDKMKTLKQNRKMTKKENMGRAHTDIYNGKRRRKEKNNRGKLRDKKGT